MKHISDPAIVELWPLDDKELLMLAKRRVENVHAPRAASFSFAYAYTPYKEQGPYRYLGECNNEGHPTQTFVVPLQPQADAALQPEQPTNFDTPTPEAKTDEGAISSNDTQERSPEIPLV